MPIVSIEFCPVMPVIRKRLVIPAFLLTLVIYFMFQSIAVEDDEYASEPFPPSSSRPHGHGKGAEGKETEVIHWHKIPENNPVKKFIQLPTSRDTSKRIPRIQYNFPKEKPSDRRTRLERQAAVKESFMHAWTGYKTHAWLKDEVSPVSGGSSNGFSGWAATLVDSLDTLLIMGMDDEFELALDAIDQIDFTTTPDKTINVFETTIRYLGGFLAAYDLSDSKYPILLKKAEELGNFVYGAFDTPNRMQVSRWNWQAYVFHFFQGGKEFMLIYCRYLAGTKQQASPSTLLAEVGSLSLEFTRLTQLTEDPKFYDAIQRVTDNLEKGQSKSSIPGLWPMIVDLQNLNFQGSQYTLGGMADSTYEYLPKQHLILAGVTDQYRRMYEKTVQPIKEHLLYRPMIKDKADILFSGTRNGGNLDHEAQHLTCFVGGMFGIGAKIFDRPEDLKIAEQLVDGCIWAYDAMATGLMPEIFRIVSCDSLERCAWDEGKWMASVARMAHLNVNDNQVIQKFIRDSGLPPGMTHVVDSKYILRYVVFYC